METEKSSKKTLKIIVIVILVLLLLVAEVLIIYLVAPDKDNEEKDSKINYQVSFDKSNYSCETGNEIEVIVNSNGEDISNGIKVISNDNSVALIDNDTGLECNNCKKIKIECLKEGNIELKAMYNNETLAKSSVLVEKVGEPIAFENSYYNCRRGEVIEANIKVGEGESVNSIKRVMIPAKGSIKESVIDFQNPANNTEKELSPTIEIDDNASSATCANCKRIRIKCFYVRESETPVEIKAETVDGKVATAKVYFSNSAMPVHFGSGTAVGATQNQVPPTRISCIKKVHITSQTLVFESELFGEAAQLKRLYTDDSDKVEVKLNGRKGNAVVPVEIYCKNAGRVDIFAEAVDGSVNVLRIGVINQEPPTGPPSTPNIKK